EGAVPGGGSLPRLADHGRGPRLRRAGNGLRSRWQRRGRRVRAAPPDRLGVAALRDRPVAAVAGAAGARSAALRPGATGTEPGPTGPSPGRGPQHAPRPHRAVWIASARG